MNNEFSGLTVMIEVGLNLVEEILPEINENLNEKLQDIFKSFLLNIVSFEDSSKKLINLIGKNDPLIKVKEIITQPLEPLPYVHYHEESSDSEYSNNFSRKKTRTWTNIEDQRLLAGVFRYGSENWKMIARFVGNGRTRAQCSQRWVRGLNPKISKKNWNDEENKLLEELVKLHGNKSWTKISASFGHRSDVQCRYHYKQLINSGTINEFNIEEKNDIITLKQDKFEIEKKNKIFNLSDLIISTSKKTFYSNNNINQKSFPVLPYNDLELFLNHFK